jgi:hypothetical protein
MAKVVYLRTWLWKNFNDTYMQDLIILILIIISF